MPAFNPVIKLALAVIAVAVAILIADVTFNSHASEQDIAPHATAPAQQPAQDRLGGKANRVQYRCDQRIRCRDQHLWSRSAANA